MGENLINSNTKVIKTVLKHPRHNKYSKVPILYENISHILVHHQVPFGCTYTTFHYKVNYYYTQLKYCLLNLSWKVSLSSSSWYLHKWTKLQTLPIHMTDIKILFSLIVVVRFVSFWCSNNYLALHMLKILSFTPFLSHSRAFSINSVSVCK